MRTITKVLLGLAALVLLLLLLVYLFQAQLGLWLASRFAAQNAGRDITASLPDGLHVGLCGSGSPMPDPTRAGPCSVVIAGRHVFIVDIGDGAARNLPRMGVPTGKVEALFLTHFHSDHIDGTGNLFLQRWAGSTAKTPLPVYGPTGVEQVVAGFNQAYALDDGYRVAHHSAAIMPPGGAGGVARPFAPPPGGSAVVYAADGLTVTAFNVNHAPATPAVGYRFDYKGRSAVLSGDTAPSTQLVQTARGADLLVHEALQPKLVDALTEALAARQIDALAQITRDIHNYHTTPEQAADAAKAAGVRYLLLNHIVPPVPVTFMDAAFLGDARSRFPGPVKIGKDGMLISMPAGSTDVTLKSLF